jgi:hypothetical protein
LTRINAACPEAAQTGYRRSSPMFTSNVGSADRMFRIILGAILITLVFVGPKTAWGWLGLIPLGTALLGTCPLYTVFGFNSGAKR